LVGKNNLGCLLFPFSQQTLSTIFRNLAGCILDGLAIQLAKHGRRIRNHLLKCFAVRVNKLDNRTFLVAKTADKGGVKSRWVGLTFRVAVDDVSDLFEFTSQEEAREAQAEAERRAPWPVVGRGAK
jgi:hypothetical protein